MLADAFGDDTSPLQHDPSRAATVIVIPAQLVPVKTGSEKPRVDLVIGICPPDGHHRPGAQRVEKRGAGNHASTL